MDNDDVKTKFITALDFFNLVEEYVWKEDVSYSDATIHVCNTLGIDPSEVQELELITPKHKDMLLCEATKNGMLKYKTMLSQAFIDME